MKLSILIVNWNSREYLRECLIQVRRTCQHLAPQIVVVDGGSFDGCAEMLAADFPDVDFVQSPENVGFGRSNNLGFEKVKGEAVLLLNPDTEVESGAIEILLEELQALSGVGMIGARLLNSDGSLQTSSVHPLPTPWNTAFDSDWGRRRWWSKKGPAAEGEPREVEAVSGACMMLRSAVFHELGGFDSRFFMYAEDMDLCFRLRKLGLKIYHAPRARIVHHGGGSSGTQFSKFSTVMIREALNVYMLKNHGRFHSLLYRFLMAGTAIVRMSLLAVVWMISTGGNRVARTVSIRKWWSVLRWSLGFEKWAGRRFGIPGSFVESAGSNRIHSDIESHVVP